MSFLSLFKLKGPVKPKEPIAYDVETIPSFRYFSNPERAFKENVSGDECLCCGSVSKYVYLGPFSCSKNLDMIPSGLKEDTLLCPNCIKDGSAAKMFGGHFTYIGNVERCKNKEGRREVASRTPSFYSLQEARWLSCCDEPCKYIGQLSDLLDLWNYESVDISEKINSDIIEALTKDDITKDMTINEIIEAVRVDGIGVYIFQCLHCGKYKISVDLG